MALKKASGNGSTNRRFARVEDVEIPVVKDAGTIVYLSENGEWSKTPIAVLATDIPWMAEGAVFDLEDLSPGTMGAKTTVQVIETKNALRIVRKGGKYQKLGQAKRYVLVQKVVPSDTLAKLTEGEL